MGRKEALYAVIGGCVGACLMLGVGSFIQLNAQSQDVHSETVRWSGSGNSDDGGNATRNGAIDVKPLIGGVVGALFTLLVGAFTHRRPASYGDVTFDKITCTDLEVVQPNGTRQVWIRVNEDGGLISVFAKDSLSGVGMGIAEHGGHG